MRPPSLARRIVLGVVVSQLLLTAGLVGVAVRTARRHLMAAFDTDLYGRAMSALALVRYSEERTPKLVFEGRLLPPPSDRGRPDLFEIRTPDGRRLAGSEGWPGPPAPGTGSDRSPGPEYVDFSEGGTPYRAVILREAAILDTEENLPGPAARVTVTYAATVSGVGRRLVVLGLTVGASGLALLAAASALAAWSVRTALLPLRDLAARASAVSVRDWTFRPTAAALATAELAPLTHALESVLARLRESFRQQRDFMGDAAHELKTSVAIVKSTIQSLLQKPRPEDEYRTGLRRLLEDCERLEDLLARMLRLARVEQWADAPETGRGGVTELTSTCEAAVARVRPMAADRGVEVELTSDAPIPVRADPEDLGLIWVNLLENALRHSPPGSRVRVQVEHGDAEGASVTVLDSGPGIPPDQLAHVFERFHRGDPSRARETGGFGLGLAICKALAEAYGGTIGAFNRPEGGARFVVRIPQSTG